MLILFSNANPLIQITCPPGSLGWYPGTTRDITWSINLPVDEGEFRLWAVDSVGTWTSVGPAVVAEPGEVDYTTSWDIPDSIAIDSYNICIFYRENTSAWSWLTEVWSSTFLISDAGTALSRFKPYAVDEGPLAVSSAIVLKTNLTGQPIRFSMSEDLSSIVPSASLTVLNADIGELGIMGGVQSDDDLITYGKVIPSAQVEPNQFIYVAEIRGAYTESMDIDGNYVYTASGSGEVCTTYWRVVSVSMTVTEADIPICEVQLEALTKIAQEARINARAMDSNDSSLILIEKSYLDSIYYYHSKYATDDGYAEMNSLADLIYSFQYGSWTTITTESPYPNGSVMIKVTNPRMDDGDVVSGVTISGIASIQSKLVEKGYHYSPDTLGQYSTETKAQIRVFQGKAKLTVDGIVGPKTWKALFPAVTTKTWNEPACRLVAVEDYDKYCDVFFKRIQDLGYNFTFTWEDSSYNDYNDLVNAVKTKDIALKYVPLYTVYETGQGVWDIITNVFAFNGLNIRFKRDNSLLVWQSNSVDIVGEDIDIGSYGTGLTLSYTKEGVINKAHVKGWIGHYELGEKINIPPFTPPAAGADPYPNGRVYLRYPPNESKYGSYMDDGEYSITGVARVQQKLLDKGYTGFTADGSYGSITKAKVTDFQRKQKIRVDGIVGPQTWGKLFPVGSENTSVVKISQVATALTGVYGITVYEADRTDSTIATVPWIKTRYPELIFDDIDFMPGESSLTYPVLATIINTYINQVNQTPIMNYWVPDSKSEATVDAFSCVADLILNVDGYSESAVVQDFEVSADYLLSSEQELKNYGEREISKTILSARSGSYSSNNIPLYAEPGMHITGASVITGTTTMLIVSLNRTTDVQQQQINTSISGNLIRSTGVADSWV